MKLKCAIIDDEPLAVSLLKNYVEKTPFLELAGSYTSAIKAMEEITNGLQPDLLFLDIPAQTFLLFRFSASLRKSTSMVRIEPKSEFRTDNTAIDICQKRI